MDTEVIMHQMTNESFFVFALGIILFAILIISVIKEFNSIKRLKKLFDSNPEKYRIELQRSKSGQWDVIEGKEWTGLNSIRHPRLFDKTTQRYIN